MRTASASRSRSTTPSWGERPCRMLNVANRMGRRYPPSARADSAAATEDEESGLLRGALKHSASALKADGMPFALAGGYALWAHGAPEPVHDVDLVLAERDVERPWRAWSAAGIHDRAAAGGLAVQGLPGDDATAPRDALVDVLHRLSGEPVTKPGSETSAELELLGIRIPVLPPTPVMVAKLRSLTEHYCDFARRCCR